MADASPPDTKGPDTDRAGGGPTGEQRGWLRRMVGVLRPYRRNVYLSFGAAILGSAGLVASPLVTQRLIDGPIRRGDGGVGPWIAVLLALAVFRGITVYCRRWFGGQVSIDVEAQLRKNIHDHLQTLDPATHDALAQGQVVSRANADVSMISQLLAILPLLTSSVSGLVLSVVVMAYLSPLLTVIALMMVPALMAAGVLLRRWAFPASLDAQQKLGELATVVEETTSGVRVVKGFGQERRELEHVERTARSLYGSRIRATRISARYTPIMQAIPNLALAAMLALGGHLALRGDLSVGRFLAFNSYLLQLVAPVRMAAMLFSVGQAARAGAERVFELLDYMPRIADADDAVELPVGRGEIRLDGVGFTYLRADDTPVLRDVTLRIAPGETVAFVGSSGSGKSTLALLIPRFHDPTSGVVRVDGVDLRTVTLASLRRRIGVVFEDAFLFSASIRDNIAFGRPEASDADVRVAAEMAEADTFIAQLPHGYDTVVGEHGLSLSGGQRQRIGLARALLTDPQILVLDDATSALDVQTEAEIHETLRRVMRGRTTILVAHRRSSLALADRIIVLSRGAVLDEGSHAELMQRCQEYRLLLTGPGESAEGDEEATVGTPPDRVGGVVRAAATTGAATGVASGPIIGIAAAPGGGAGGFRAVGMGGGMGGGAPGMHGGGMAMGGGFGYNPAPETLARMAMLPPATEQPEIDADPAMALAEMYEPKLRLRDLIRPHRWMLALGFALVAVDAVLTLLGPVLIRHGLDEGVEKGAGGVVRAAALVYLAVTLIDVLVVWTQTVLTSLVGERVLYRLRLRVFAHLQRLALDFYEREMAGRILTRMTGDIDSLANLLQNGLLSLLSNGLSFLGVGVFLFVLDWRLALVSLLSVPPLLVATLWFRHVSARAYEAVRERVATVNANLSESLSGVRVVQAFSREGRNTTNFATVVGSHRAARLDGQRAASIYFPIVEVIGVLATTSVLWAGAGMVRGGSVTIGELVAFVLYLNLFFGPIQQLSAVFDTFQQAGAAMNKLRDLLAEPSTVVDAPDARVLPAGRSAVTGRIELRGVRFAYATGGGTAGEALRGVNLTIEPGETVALVGATGAGKSTLLKLIVRYYDPTEGEVLVDGVNLRSISLASWRAHLGVVPQESALFSGSIADNIAYGRPGASRAEIETAARAVGADDFIVTLSDGYDTQVAARGRSLSAGQRQLIALARASLVDPAVLLLDEATANLDLATEARVQRAMGVLSRDRTTVLIAHRLDTARRADRMIVMDDGCVAESGTHDELLAINGVYARLWQSASGEERAKSYGPA